MLNFFNQIKSILVLAVLSLLGIIAWRTKKENENLKDNLREVREDIITNTADTEVKVAEKKIESVVKESEIKVKVVEELSTPTDTTDIKKQFEEHKKDGKTFDITV